VGREGSLALDETGTPYAAYTVRTGARTSEVRLAVRGDAGWSAEALSRPPGAVSGGGFAPSLAFTQGDPRVTYVHVEGMSLAPFLASQDLILAVRSSTGWTDEVVVDGLNDPSFGYQVFPQFPMMVADRCGNPHLAFFYNVNVYGDTSQRGVYYATKGECAPTTATLRVEPRTLNLRSKGKWITATVTLDGATIAEVDLGTLAVNGITPDKVRVLNATVLQLKISREDFVDTLPDPPKFGVAVTVTLTGKWKDGGDFTATDSIRILRPGR